MQRQGEAIGHLGHARSLLMGCACVAATGLVAGHSAEVLRDRRARGIVQRASGLVSHPAMHAASARVDEEHVLKAEVFAQRLVQHFDGCVDESPALVAELGALAACARAVVSVHINIKDKLSFLRCKILHCRVRRRSRVEDGANVDLVGLLLLDLPRQ